MKNLVMIKALLLSMFLITGCQSSSTNADQSDDSSHGNEKIQSNELRDDQQEITYLKHQLSEKEIEVSGISSGGEHITLESKSENSPVSKLRINFISEDVDLKREQSTVNYKGNSIARILFYAFQNQPESLELSKNMSSEMNSLYADVSRGVVMQENASSTDKNIRQINITVGGSENTLEEKKAAMNILSQIIRDYLVGN